MLPRSPIPSLVPDGLNHSHCSPEPYEFKNLGIHPQRASFRDDIIATRVSAESVQGLLRLYRPSLGILLR